MLAARTAAKLARELGVEAIEFEGDSSIVLVAINQKDSDDNSHFGTVINEVRHYLRSLPILKILHTRRGANRVAID
ncbi:hypothetical protein COP1_047142 [Malus domestica]